MTRILASIGILFCVYQICSCCQMDRYGTCEKNEECCSGYCNKPPGVDVGICTRAKKPTTKRPTTRRTRPTTATTPTTSPINNEMTNCQEGDCKGDDPWKKPNEQLTGDRVNVEGKCHENGWDNCESNSDCCSKSCDRDPSRPRGVCEPKECEPLISDKLAVECETSIGRWTECNQPLPPDSSASFQCNKPDFVEIKKPEYSTIKCKSGKWDPPFTDNFCGPECGTPAAYVKPFVSNGQLAYNEDYPWHAAIYQKDETSGSYTQICGGSVITLKVVVSAAHCFTTQITELRKVVVKELSLFKVAVGKNFRDIKAKENSAQIVDIEAIRIPYEYRGSIALYGDDIAFVTLQTRLKFTITSRPVCVDLTERTAEEEENLLKGAVGQVVGWGLTEYKMPSETLRLAEMPFVARNECITSVTNTLLTHISVSKSKICAGNRSSIVNVCSGDSGGGLVFEDPDTKKYFLRGIVSFGVNRCRGKEYTMFEKLSSHKRLLREFLQIS